MGDFLPGESRVFDGDESSRSDGLAFEVNLRARDVRTEGWGPSGLGLAGVSLLLFGEWPSFGSSADSGFGMVVSEGCPRKGVRFSVAEGSKCGPVRLCY